MPKEEKITFPKYKIEFKRVKRKITFKKYKNWLICDLLFSPAIPLWVKKIKHRVDDYGSQAFKFN